MTTERKLLGATLLGLAVLTNSKEARVLLGVTGAAVLFPEHTKLVASEIANAFKVPETKSAATVIVVPVVAEKEKQPENVGLLRRIWNYIY